MQPLYDQPPRKALSLLAPEVREAWRERYITLDGDEPRVLALVERTEAAMRTAGEPTTIRTLWIALADRAGREDSADLRAAAALAGMALGLQAG